MLMRLTILFLIFLSNTIYAQIDGRYESTCLPFGKGQDESFKSTITITGNKVDMSLRFYSDSGCGFESFALFLRTEANYPEGVLTGPFDQRIGDATFLVTDPEFIKRHTASEKCKLLNFAVGQKKSISSLGGCGPLSIPAVGTIIFDMFLRKGDQITFGAYPFLWVSDEDKRPLLPGSVSHRTQ